ncbi:MAG TPA: hypothetical protein HA362_02515 [Nanoarchaeota archaeon]|nr:hypothetical protein [Nanoarchaeota archaeon]
MGKLRELGLTLAAAGAAVGFAALTLEEPKIYEVPAGRCVEVDGCGELCYNGFLRHDGGKFSLTMNGAYKEYPTGQEEIAPCGCALKAGAVSGKSVTLTQKVRAFDLP